jgi:hypothetical protein
MIYRVSLEADIEAETKEEAMRLFYEMVGDEAPAGSSYFVRDEAGVSYEIDVRSMSQWR